MSDPAGKPSLEDLLTKALVKLTPQKPRRKPSDSITPEELARAERRMRERFTDPANWERVRHVSLIHQETDTLLGNFAEYKHKLSTARKFMRVTEPAAVDSIEYVTGSNWLSTPVHAQLPQEAIDERQLIIDLHLKELDNVFSPDVLVDIRLEYGGVARVQLCYETRFFSKDRREQLILPEGLDVLEVMSLDNKLELRKALGL